MQSMLGSPASNIWRSGWAPAARGRDSSAAESGPVDLEGCWGRKAMVKLSCLIQRGGRPQGAPSEIEAHTPGTGASTA